MPRRLVVVVSIAALVALVAAGSALATNKRYYTASSSPLADIPAGQATTRSVTLFNCGGSPAPAPCPGTSNAALGSAKIDFPDQFAVSVTSISPAGWTWTVDTGALVKVKAPNDSSKVSWGKSLTVTVSLTTCTVGGPSAVATSAFYDRSWGTSLAFTRYGPDPTVNVVPGALGSFVLGEIASPQTAGSAFDVSAAAKDVCGNPKSNYNTVAALGGNLSVANDGTLPRYGSDGSGTIAFTAGTGTAQVTAYMAETGRTVTVSDAGVGATSDPPFAVDPGPVKSLVFAQQPTTSELAPAVIAPPVEVDAFDDWGNAATNALGDVAIALGSNPPDASLAGGSAALSGGTATFAALSVSKVGSDFTLVASYPGADDATSGFFDIANDVQPCAGSGCSGSATADNGQATATSVAGTLPPGTLLTTTFLTGGPPTGVCSGFTPLGIGTEVVVTGGTPTYTITYTIPSNLIAPWKAAFLFNVCLGAKWLGSDPAQPWLTKDIAFASGVWKRKPAVADAELRYWGLAPSCAFSSGEPIPFLPIPATNPCVISKTRTGFLGLNGNLVMKVKVPQPWDPRGFIG